jgi:hypothetical protein
MLYFCKQRFLTVCTLYFSQQAAASTTNFNFQDFRNNPTFAQDFRLTRFPQVSQINCFETTLTSLSISKQPYFRPGISAHQTSAGKSN